jgi:hypothetical protein
MNHKHRATLHALFSHPISNNIDPKEVKAMFDALGGEVTHGGHGHLLLKLNGFTHGFHDSKHNLSKDEISAIKMFLTDAGVDPLRDYPL